MRRISRWCSPWWLCLSLAGMVFLLLALGVWQLNRAEEKSAIEASFSDRQSEPPLRHLPDQIEADSLRYSRVLLRGRFDARRQFLQDNQIRNRRAGYNVLTPFQLENGQWVLVDRGWIDQGLSRQLLPDIAMDSSEKPQALSGVVYIPFGQAFALGGMDDDAVGWPRVIQFLDFPALSARLDVPLMPLVIRMAPEADQGFLRQWPLVGMVAEKHIGYAVQWFALAVALLVLIVMFNRRQNL